ncbi:hypothetical protein BT69DRAFT_1257656 [Atractiella rhizophila]|nr:hypothetical protein BT69DRAFT_1257656 [Atractiella rhizophila]
MATTTTPPLNPPHSKYYDGTDVWARQYVLRHTTVKGIQLFSLVYPPLLLAGMAWKRSFSVGRFMRNSALVGLGGGAAFGALAGWGRLRSVEEEGVRDRAERLRANWGQNTVDDYSLVGGFLGSLITTTVFLRRASPLWLVPGGASLGVAGGILAHVVHNWEYVRGSGDLKHNPMVEEARMAIQEVKEGAKKE